MSIYIEFARFLAPLMMTAIIAELGIQVLNGGMARMSHATETLASYGLAWCITTLLVSPLLQVRQVALVLVDSKGALRIAAILAALLAFSFTAVHGATQGVASLPTGFVVATVAVWLGVRGLRRVLGRH